MGIVEDDLARIFTDTAFAVSVEFGAPVVQYTRGFLSSEDVAENDPHGGVVIVTRRVLTVQEGALSGLVNGATVTVAGKGYTLHGVRSAGRGKTKLVLA